jgi:hypothetical protein
MTIAIAGIIGWLFMLYITIRLAGQPSTRQQRLRRHLTRQGLTMKCAGAQAFRFIADHSTMGPYIGQPTQ